MKDIKATRFTKIGTNPNAYINNYLNCFNVYEQFDSFEIIDYKIFYKGEVVFSANSDATFRQNIQCWISLGFFIKKNDILLKIIPSLSKNELLEHCKGILLVSSNDENINMYRNTILIKILRLSGVDISSDIIRTRDDVLTNEAIDKETGEFEKNIYIDEVFVRMVKELWGK